MTAEPVAAVFRLAAGLDAFEQSARELSACLADAGVGRIPKFNTEVVFEEIVTNIIRHGQQSGVVSQIQVSVLVEENAVELVFIDDGVAFNPCEAPEPAPFGRLEEIELGGLGISLTRKVSDSMCYERTPQGQNRLSVRVSL